ncbi:uncharacterized protein LOC105209258 [Zeugodacus cucurbitae]|uniref:7-cyano-7-deazaguanine synthase n=2 Tax=Zeugodacus cucurbitae TaxID=28588 RepID=A0A0A1WDN4_ZEUCU|nr:uncharacterized protein LOC105209258 [Zeugodacus cucurbitae]
MNMRRCQSALLHLSLLLSVLALDCALAASIYTLDDTAPLKPTEEPTKFVVITEDVIPDVANTTQKVIRVNPLDLPALSEDSSGSTDSSLYKIQSLLPANRNYVNSNRMRGKKTRPKDVKAAVETNTADSPIIRHITEPKFRKPSRNQKKNLHFLYNQEALDGHKVSKTMNVRVAPGAYPVYYAVSKTNGRFGKYPLKSFRTPTEFLKYLAKSKVTALEQTQRLES